MRKAMILAAGFGERVRPLSLVRPKPVFPVLNRPLIARTLDGLAGAGVTQVVVNAHHLAPVLAACLAGLTGGPTVHFLEEDRILGTGGGVKNAARYLAGEPFLLINGDVVTDLDLKALAEAYLAGPPGAATLAVHDHPVFNGGLAVDSGGVVRGFRRDWPRDDPGLRPLAFTGAQVVGPEVLDTLPDGPSDLIETYRELVRRGRPIRAFGPMELSWWDAGSLDGYLDLHAHLLAGRTRIDDEARVDPGAEIRGWACIAAGAVVERGAVIEDSILWPRARVGRGVRVRRSVLADGARADRDLDGEMRIGPEGPAAIQT